MGDKALEALNATLLEEACLSLEQLAYAGAVTPAWVLSRLEQGILTVSGRSGTLATEWRFSSRDLRRLRQVRRLEQDFDANPELAALVADLMEEVAILRTRLRRTGLG